MTSSNMTRTTWTIKTFPRHLTVTAIASSLCVVTVCNLFVLPTGHLLKPSSHPKNTVVGDSRMRDIVVHGSEASRVADDAVFQEPEGRGRAIESSAGLGHLSTLRNDRGRRGLLEFLTETDKQSSWLSETFDSVRLEPVSQRTTSRLTCSEIQKIRSMRYISRGWTKVVHGGIYNGARVAVKTVDVGGHDVTSCVAHARSLTYCLGVAARKIVREIVLLDAVSHDNVIKVLGFCISPNSSDGHVASTVVMVTELGEPIDQIKLLQMSWDDRLRVAYDLTQLIHHLSRTPHGSLVLNDFRRTQFVLVNGSLKLTDVDDATFGEPTCSGEDQCVVVSEDSGVTHRLSCIDGYCQHHNEFSNIKKAGHYFITSYLRHGTPGALKPWIDDVISGYLNLNMDIKQLLKVMDHVIELYRSGSHLDQRERTHNDASPYALYRNSDLPGQFDYRCGLAVPGTGCTLSVFDLQEAKDLCDLDSQCKGFIWTHRKTWTGRTMIHLKNGMSTFSLNESTDVYVKPG